MSKKPKKPSVFDRHQLAIAKKTLKMHDLAVKALGGMTKEEAREIVARLDARWPK